MISNRHILCVSLFIFCSFQMSSQELKSKNFVFSDLTRFTIGFHHTNYNSSNFYNESNINRSGLEVDNSNGFFIDYRVLNYKNHSLTFGVFFNTFKNNVKFDGFIYSNDIDEYVETNGEPYPSKEKMKQIELYLNYNYYFKIDTKTYLNLSFGASNEINGSNSNYSQSASFSYGNFNPTQIFYESDYEIKRNYFRFNLNPSIAYKTKVGMINLGIKYSIPFKTIMKGEYRFLDPGPNGENFEYNGKFDLSGKYLSTTLSFTPSKNIFKKKK
jgi:hypothetical protein